MKKFKICSIVGARPQFIKLAPLSIKLRENFEEIIVHTGQHFDKEMSDLFFKELSIPEPDYNLNIHEGGHGSQTGRMLIELEKVIQQITPDLVIVFGDTNTTLAGAIVAAKLNIKVIHVEAGLRSFNRRMPEEINRVVADHTGDYLFAPTQTAVNNLKNEGLAEKTFLSGDIMVDALLQNIQIARNNSDVLTELSIDDEFFLLTLHRPYNVDDSNNLKKILNELNNLEKKIIFPVHPRTRKVITDNDIKIGENIQLINPLGYLDFIKLQDKSSLILTDSGGIQKEAFILKKQCVTLRSETEWIETLEDGWNILIDVSKDNIGEKILKLKIPLSQKEFFGTNVAKKMSNYIFQTIAAES